MEALIYLIKSANSKLNNTKNINKTPVNIIRQVQLICLNTNNLLKNNDCVFELSKYFKIMLLTETRIPGIITLLIFWFFY